MLHDKLNYWPIPEAKAGSLCLQEQEVEISFEMTNGHFTVWEWDTIKVFDKPTILWAG